MASFPSENQAPSTPAADHARLAELDAEIDALERRLRTAHRQRKLVKARLKAYKYPVLTLPNEIVFSIFTRVLPVYPRCPPAISPTLLSSVCRKWREIALSTPTLWRAISISISMYPHINIESRLPLLEAWLARSQSRPLSISLADNWYAEASDSEMAPFIQAILPHCNRWEYLSLLVADPDAFSPIHGDMPLLRHLRIGVTPGTMTNTNLDPVVLFQQAPRLQTVTLLTSLPPEITLPWAQLTRLMAQDADPDMCSRFLEHAPNLIYCTLQLHGSRIEWAQRHLARLETLILEDVSAAGHQLRGLLESLTLPSLRKLHIPRKFLLPDSVVALETFIARSGCKLEELYIISPHDDVSTEFYRKIFPSIPTLEVKQYYDLDDDDNPELDFDEDN
ncbi:hypothetical protein B0H11DRAFT_830070 [Mycena galericulata]|nr:hypothetical protein B0H11DRAFT_830070 [Mycena galericulata]